MQETIGAPKKRQHSKRSLYICERCGSAAIHRSHARWYEAWLKLLTSQRPYRCAACRTRTWRAHAPAESVAESFQEPDVPWPADLGEPVDCDGSIAAPIDGADVNSDRNVSLAALDAAESFKPHH